MAAERGRAHEAPLLTFPPLSTVLGEAQNEPHRQGGGWERGVKGGKRRGAEWGRQSDRWQTFLCPHQFAPEQARRPKGAWAAGGKRAEPSPPPPGRVGGRRDRSGGAGTAPERLPSSSTFCGAASAPPVICITFPALCAVSSSAPPSQICVMQSPREEYRILSAAIPCQA